MQNTDNEATNTTNEEFTKGDATKPPTEHQLTRSDTQTPTELEHQEQEDQDQQEGKLKTRSRFSAALRSFSKPKPKKEKRDKSKEKRQDIQVRSEPVLTSVDEIVSLGGDSVAEGSGPKPKKKSLTHRLLLGGLKKSKVRPHSLDVTDEISVLSSSSREQEQPTSSTSTLGGVNRSSSSSVQITISGKKIEPVKSASKSGSSKSKSRKSAASETDYDYLTPIPTGKPTKSTTTTTKITTKDITSSTKLIVAKAGGKQADNNNTVASVKKKLKPKKISPTTEEKIVITESTRDTPPRERAPAKPSRVGASTASSTTTIQSVGSSLIARKSSSTRTKEAISAAKKSLRTERELMQQQQQRGHRLIRPTTATPATTLKPQVGDLEAVEPASSQAPAPSSTEQPQPQPPNYPPPPVPAVTSQEDEKEVQEHSVSSAESAHTGTHTSSSTPTVRFAVGSAVRPPANAYETALAAAAASQQPSSSESQSESSLRRLNYSKQQQLLDDHDSIEGRRETLHYQSVASEFSNSGESQSDDCEPSEIEQQKPMPAFGDLTMDQEMEPTIMSPSNEKREHLYKILVIGELGTGKTSFIKRYVHQFFSQNYRATIGVDFALKVLHWDANTIVRLQLWDIAGQERFGNMTRVYYKEAVGAFIVFDVTRSGTFDCVSKWKEDLDSKVQLPDGSPIPCILLANKCDQEKQGIVTQPEKMDEYVRENGFAGWFETSAKENINIDEAARALVNKILINDKLITAADLADADKFNLNSSGDASGTEVKNKCSC